ncbi:MAG TPA: alpha/beta hydrolase [Acidimicrobiales bacterium]|nr:alpha/beta hydrolase [Acidimicrobiales bacterium]
MSDDTNTSTTPASCFLHAELVGEGPPCFVAHGGPGLHHGLYRGLDPMAAHSLLVYWDHRGHGRSDSLPDGPVPMSLFADDAVSLADRLGVDTFAVFGHSFGGWVAQELALRHPDRVSALILAATTPGQLGLTESPDDDQGPPPPDDLADLLATRPATDAQLIELYTRLAPYYFPDGDPKELLAALSPELVSADSVIRVFDALSSWSAVDRLGDIACPTLLLAGRRDLFCSPQQLDRIARRIPHAESVVFENTGHFMWLEEPDRFFRIVGDWLAQRGSSSAPTPPTKST